MEFNIVAELAERTDATKVDALVDALAGYHPAVGASDRGRFEVVITVLAESLRQASTTGLAILAHALPDREVVAYEVLSTKDFDERNGIEYLPDVVGVSEAAEIMGVSRQRVLQLVEAGSLPHARAGKAVVIPRAAAVKRATGG